MKHSTGDNWWVPKSQQGNRASFLSPSAIKNMQKVNQSQEEKKRLITEQSTREKEEESNSAP